MTIIDKTLPSAQVRIFSSVLLLGRNQEHVATTCQCGTNTTLPKQRMGKERRCPPTIFDAVDQWRTEWGGGLGCSNPSPEIPKALQNRAKLNPIVKTVKNC